MRTSSAAVFGAGRTKSLSPVAAKKSAVSSSMGPRSLVTRTRWGVVFDEMGFVLGKMGAKSCGLAPDWSPGHHQRGCIDVAVRAELQLYHLSLTMLPSPSVPKKAGSTRLGEIGFQYLVVSVSLMT